MNKEECDLYKDMGIWKKVLCRYCIASKCITRLYSYDLCTKRERNRKMRYCYETIVREDGQYEWDFFRYMPEVAK